MTRRVERILCGAAVCIVLCGGAQAQTPTPAGELAARQAAETQPLPPLPEPGPLPPPASCGAQNCLTLEISDRALRSLDRGADPAEFGEGLSFALEAAGAPPSVYFLAVRYENGRLAEYATTEWVRPDAGGEGLIIDGIAEAVADAAMGPGVTGVEVAAASRSMPVWTVPVHTEGFLIAHPRTFLIGTPDMAPVDEASAPADLVAAAEEGSLLLLTVAAADKALRAPDQSKVTGVVVRLTPAD